MDRHQIVLDTNVLVSGLRSSQGASHRLLGLIGRSTAFEINISVPVVLEYEEVLKRQSRVLGLTHADVTDFVDYLCAVGNHREIFFLWRPILSDPEDDMILELAVESNSEYIITFNLRDFEGVGAFGIKVVTPRDFLRIIGEIA